MLTWVEELKRNLTQRELAIWTGKNPDGSTFTIVSGEKQLRFRELWKGLANETIQQPGTSKVILTTESKRPDCIHLGTIRLRTNSQGVECLCPQKWLHNCELFVLCVKADDRLDVRRCDKCNKYEADTPTEPE